MSNRRRPARLGSTEEQSTWSHVCVVVVRSPWQVPSVTDSQTPFSPGSRPAVSSFAGGTALIGCLTLTDVMRVAEEAARTHQEFTPVAALATSSGSSYAE